MTWMKRRWMSTFGPFGSSPYRQYETLRHVWWAERSLAKTTMARIHIINSINVANTIGLRLSATKGCPVLSLRTKKNNKRQNKKKIKYFLLRNLDYSFSLGFDVCIWKCFLYLVFILKIRLLWPKCKHIKFSKEFTFLLSNNTRVFLPSNGKAKQSKSIIIFTLDYDSTHAHSFSSLIVWSPFLPPTPSSPPIIFRHFPSSETNPFFPRASSSSSLLLPLSFQTERRSTVLGKEHQLNLGNPEYFILA